MSDVSLPPSHQGQADLAAANRKLTSAILGMTLLTGLIACMSYLAGRTVTHMKTESANITRTEIPAPPVVVTPAEKHIGGVAPPPAAPPPATSPSPAHVTPPVASSETYWQVGIVNPAAESYLQDRLKKLGLEFRLSPMEDSPHSRVLVGPLRDVEEQSAIEGILRQNGFQYFKRRL